MNKHTPGPWTVGFGDVSGLEYVYASDPREVVVSGIRKLADAELISAAPELLQALRACELRLTALAANSKSGATFEINMARAAIAMAEGRQ